MYKTASDLYVGQFRTFSSMQQYIQDHGQRRVAPSVKNSSLSQFSTTDSASSYVGGECQHLAKATRQIAEPYKYNNTKNIIHEGAKQMKPQYMYEELN